MRKLGPWQADYIELYGQMVVDDLKCKVHLSMHLY